MKNGRILVEAQDHYAVGCYYIDDLNRAPHIKMLIANTRQEKVMSAKLSSSSARSLGDALLHAAEQMEQYEAVYRKQERELG